MSKGKIVVTGGAGFIGSHLCKALYEKGYHVVSIDNYSTSTPDTHIPGVSYIKGNTKDVSESMLKGAHTLYHLGEYSRVEQSFSEIDKVLKSNQTGTSNIIKLCTKLNIKLVYAGSSTKFGDGGLGRYQSPYAFTKASNTELIKCFGTWSNLRYAIVYFYNVYGPGEISEGKYATLIALFKQLAKDKKALTVVSPGTQVRNFTHVYDIIKGLLLVGENTTGDDFGIGNKESYTIKQIAEVYKETYNLKEDIVMLPPRAGNRLQADVLTDKLEKLGWTATHCVLDYIKRKD